MEPQTYSESAKGVKINAARAALEVKRHGLDPEDFFNECGRRTTYKASDVMNWLGY